MKTEKSISSMIFVLIVSFILISSSFYIVFTTLNMQAKIISLYSILFISPVFLYSLLIFLKNYKKRADYKLDIQAAMKIQSFSSPPKLTDYQNRINSGKNRINKTEIFIER